MIFPPCGGEWFNAHVSRSVGDGRHTYFWSDVWIGGVASRDRFRRMYDLSVSKWLSVANMFQSGWGAEGEVWVWRQRLFAWEEEQVGDLTSILQSVTLQVQKEDKWLWNFEKSNVFSVRSGYNHLTATYTVVNPVDAKLLWHKDIPLKVVIFDWRLFRNRLPTKDYLFWRGILNNDYRMCASGCGSLETLNHLFLHCSFFGAVWYYIF